MLKIMANNIDTGICDNWSIRKYEDYNGCPYCGGKICMEGSVSDFQKFRCLKCSKEFILHTITQRIELR